MAGHSVGELSALTLAGALEPEEALRLVVQRAQLMNSVLEPFQGGMLALVGVTVTEWFSIIQAWNEQNPQYPVFPANFNGADQLIIAGLKPSLQAWQSQIKEFWRQHKGHELARLKMIELNVSAPFHSPLMEPACPDGVRSLNP